MKNKEIIVRNGGLTAVYSRHDRRAAGRCFAKGMTVSLMSIDRNPVSSLTSEVDYVKGGKGFFQPHKVMDTFDDVLEDFSMWLECDGYGHVPDVYRARYGLFSYWTSRIMPE